MTMEEIKGLDRDMLTAQEVAPVIGCDPQLIRIQAREDPYKLGFPVCVIGTERNNRVKIPRLGFIYWMEHGHAVIES